MFRIFRRPVAVSGGGAVAVPFVDVAMPRPRRMKTSKPRTRRQRSESTAFVRSDFDPFLGRRI